MKQNIKDQQTERRIILDILDRQENRRAWLVKEGKVDFPMMKDFDLFIDITKKYWDWRKKSGDEKKAD